MPPRVSFSVRHASGQANCGIEGGGIGRRVHLIAHSAVNCTRTETQQPYPAAVEFAGGEALGRGAARGPSQQTGPAQCAEGEPAPPRSGGRPAGQQVLLPAVHDEVGEGIHTSHRPGQEA